MESTYRIPNCNMVSLKEQIAEINKKAIKIGVPAVTMTVVGTDQESVTRERFGSKFTELVTYSIVELCGVTPKFEGWRFVGKLERKADINVFFTVPGESIPETYRNRPDICDHCNMSRIRNLTYVVYHDETGLYKQVGSTCIQDFLGGESPHNVAAWLQYLSDFDDEVDDAQDSSYGGRCNSRNVTLNAIEFLSWVNCIVRHFGFVSRKNADMYDKTPTSVEAYCCYTWDGRGEDPKKVTYKGEEIILGPNENDVETATRAVTWIRAWTPDEVSRNEYSTTMYYTFVNDYVLTSEIGRAASLMSIYNRHIEGELTKANKTPSVHVGTVGKREVFPGLTVVNVYSYDSEYGVTFKYLMDDPNGNRLTWSTGKDVLNVGETYSLKASVKAHGEYKGVKQTQLTRCTIV